MRKTHLCILFLCTLLLALQPKANAKHSVYSPLAKTQSNSIVMSISLKLYLQGYYADGTMNPVLLNQLIGTSSTEVDTIIIQFHHPVTHSLIASKKGVLQTNGNITVIIDLVPGLYFISVKHRGTITTWSAAPVNCTISSPVYDFTTAASQAFGNNQVLVAPGVYAFYAGDYNQDGFVDGNDFPLFDAANYAAIHFVYAVTDLNGDGFVDGNDYPIFNRNSYNGVVAKVP